MSRLTWLLAVPLASSLVPWVVHASNGGVDSLGRTGFVLLGALPLAGAVASRAYARAAHREVRWWPLAPYTVVAATFLMLLAFAVHESNGDGFELIPVLLIGLFQPVLALVGGLVSFAWVPRRAQQLP